MNEITQIVDKFGFPQNDDFVPYDKYWETDFELGIEIQVWVAPSQHDAPRHALLRTQRAAVLGPFVLCWPQALLVFAIRHMVSRDIRVLC